ncbi:hypothetical protein BKA69DRAFT_1058185 [Paraphysoderma sedebokerense]|nr:hypothetical protein BKA69DRAFT_1058185 [Paraphysoderma sedebokerense]
MCLAGSAAVEGSIKWWCQGHRAHHRYTDTDDDPYSAHKGLFWSHIGWMLVKKKNDKLKTVDISDLMADPLVRFQHKYYGLFALVMGFLLPTVIAGLGWGDYKGGFFFAAVARLVFVHHATFCVNSLAHYLGDTNYDDKLSPRDHFITALMTFGEGYHNFHHQYPQDYRNAIRFYQFDPTKWLIKALSFYGITYNLKKFPDNEVKKGAIQMKQKKLDVERQQLDWGIPIEQLPIWRELDFKAKLQQKSSLIIIDDIVYDVGNFVDEHPGGKGFLKTSFGKNVTDQFNGKVYDHSNAARNLMTRFRVARLSNTKEE